MPANGVSPVRARGTSVARARALAERAHRGQVEPSGRPYVAHVRRVAAAAPPFARSVAWLHAVPEWTGVDERQLVAAGLARHELAALRLLTRARGGASDEAFLAHVRVIAGARGPSGAIARAVKRADMEDRARHPRDPEAPWAPPYGRALLVLAESAGPGGGPGSGVSRARGSAPSRASCAA